MNFLHKIIGLFHKTKRIAVNVSLKIDKFISGHKKQIKLLMTVLEAIFPAKTGAKKMACIVTNVCSALGYSSYSEEIMDYIETKCQEVYDEFKGSLE